MLTFKCASCEHVKPMIEVSGLSEKIAARGARYICAECAERERGKNLATIHSPAGHGFSFALTLWGDEKSEPALLALKSSGYQFEMEHVNGYLKIYTPVYENASGVKSLLRSVSNLCKISFYEIEFIDDETVVNCGLCLDIQTLMRDAGYNVSYNIKFLVHRGFSDCNKTLWDVFEAREILKTVETNYVKYIGTEKAKHKKEIAIGKIQSIIEKYDSGEADCQKAKRNSKNK